MSKENGSIFSYSNLIKALGILSSSFILGYMIKNIESLKSILRKRINKF